MWVKACDDTDRRKLAFNLLKKKKILFASDKLMPKMTFNGRGISINVGGHNDIYLQYCQTIEIK